MSPASALDAVVVGAGPNGLVAAITLARAGLGVRLYEAAATIGGGARTDELTLPDFRHDVCSAVHPLGAGSPVLRSLPLAEHGLTWVQPPLPVANPLASGGAAVLHRSLDETSAGSGRIRGRSAAHASPTLTGEPARWRRSSSSEACRQRAISSVVPDGSPRRYGWGARGGAR